MADLKGKFDRSVIPKIDLGRTHFNDRQDTEQHTEYPWEEGKKGKVITALSRGKGKLLPENLRRLPEDYVAKDIDDPNRIHELDPHHIRSALSSEKYESEEGIESTAFGTGERDEPNNEEIRHVPVNEMTVSLVKLRVFSKLLERAQTAHEKKDLRAWHEAMKVHHLWFPENDLNDRFLYPGNPPPDSQRPPHLRGLDLVVDPKAGVPQQCLDMIQANPLRTQIFLEHFDNQVLAAADKIISDNAKRPIVVVN